MPSHLIHCPNPNKFMQSWKRNLLNNVVEGSKFLNKHLGVHYCPMKSHLVMPILNGLLLFSIGQNKHNLFAKLVILNTSSKWEPVRGLLFVAQINSYFPMVKGSDGRYAVTWNQNSMNLLQFKFKFHLSIWQIFFQPRNLPQKLIAGKFVDRKEKG